MDYNDKIIEKIRNLLELAEDGAHDEESQTALLMAQKLMLKYKISQNQLSDVKPNEIILKSLSFYKRVYWWEKLLVRVIADNFRVMFYLQSNRLPHQSGIQRKVVLMGYEEDVELAYEMFHLAANAMKYYATYHVNVEADKTKQSQAELRRAYYQGFIDGLDSKFVEQREQMKQKNEKFALVIQTPDEVKQAFHEQVKGTIRFKQPRSNKSVAAYSEGFAKGNKLILNEQFIEENQK